MITKLLDVARAEAQSNCERRRFVQHIAAIKGSDKQPAYEVSDWFCEETIESYRYDYSSNNAVLMARGPHVLTR